MRDVVHTRKKYIRFEETKVTLPNGALRTTWHRATFSHAAPGVVPPRVFSARAGSLAPVPAHVRDHGAADLRVGALVPDDRQRGERHRVIEVVRHVLFARPDQLDRRARYLLGDHDRLAHEIGSEAAAEPTADQLLVDVAFLDRQARHFSGSSKRRLRAAADGSGDREATQSISVRVFAGRPRNAVRSSV